MQLDTPKPQLPHPSVAVLSHLNTLQLVEHVKTQQEHIYAQQEALAYQIDQFNAGPLHNSFPWSQRACQLYKNVLSTPSKHQSLSPLCTRISSQLHAYVPEFSTAHLLAEAFCGARDNPGLAAKNAFTPALSQCLGAVKPKLVTHLEQVLTQVDLINLFATRLCCLFTASELQRLVTRPQLFLFGSAMGHAESMLSSLLERTAIRLDTLEDGESPPRLAEQDAPHFGVALHFFPAVAQHVTPPWFQAWSMQKSSPHSFETFWETLMVEAADALDPLFVPLDLSAQYQYLDTDVIRQLHERFLYVVLGLEGFWSQALEQSASALIHFTAHRARIQVLIQRSQSTEN